MVKISDITEVAAQLGKDNAARDEAKGIERTAEDSAANTALESLFDGAEALNTRDGRTHVNIAYRMGYSGHWA